MVLHSGAQNDFFFQIFKTKIPLTNFFNDCGENAHEGTSSNGESECVILIFFCFKSGQQKWGECIIYIKNMIKFNLILI